MTSSCSLCDKPARARGWCRMHYYRWRRHGDPHAMSRQYSIADRLRAYTRPSAGGCLEWVGAKTRGYGWIRLNGTSGPAHRAAYEQAHGPVPPNIRIDHICRNKACVNPAHLRKATPAQNRANSVVTKTSSGYRGVGREGSGWRARITVAGRLQYLGHFDTKEAAACAWRVAAERFYGEFIPKEVNRV